VDAARRRHEEESQRTQAEILAKRGILEKNALQRKAEEAKLKQEQDDIDKKTREIEELKKKLKEKQEILKNKEEEKKALNVFTEFLQKVVANNDGDKEGFESIPDL
jgi:peptidoglycan hydrolase CwlO-like protein